MSDLPTKPDIPEQLVQINVSGKAPSLWARLYRKLASCIGKLLNIKLDHNRGTEPLPIVKTTLALV